MVLENMLSRKILNIEISSWIIVSMLIIYSITFSFYTLMRHHSFRSNAWDLGIYVQSLSNALRGKLFPNNVELYYSQSGSYFGVHFSPILFIVLPYFYVAPIVETILVIQSVVLALGAIPIYLISKHHLNERIPALLLSSSYLLNPLLQGINWYDFHTQAFFPLLILTSTYYLKKRKILLFIFFILLSLTIMEQAAYLVAVYSLYCLLEVRRSPVSSAYPDFHRRFIRVALPIIVLIISLAWIVTACKIQDVINPNPPIELKAIDNYRILGISDPVEIPIKALTDFVLIVKAIQYDLHRKILYIVLTFASSAFLAFLSPVTLIPSIIWIFLSILSNWPPYYQLGFQYAAFTLPFIFIATIESIYSLTNTEGRSVKRLALRLCILILILNVLLSIMASPLSPIHNPGDFSYFRDYGVTFPSNLNIAVRHLLEVIPKNSTVITTATIFPHLSTYANAYVLPPLNFPSQRLFKNHLNYLKNVMYDYIILMYFWDKQEASILYNEIVKGNRFYGLYIRGAGLEIYKRGHLGPYQNITLRFSSRELLSQDSLIVDDPSSESNQVFMLKPYTLGRCAWYGPYVTLTPGTYTVKVRLKIDKSIDEDVLKLDVWARGMEIMSQIISGKDFSKPLTWHTFTIKFTITERVDNVEFRGMNVAEGLTLWLDYIEVLVE